MKQKTAYLILALIVLNFSASAQLKGFSLGPYMEAAWPKGDMLTTNTNGIGAGLSADVKLGGKLAATGSVGFLHFGGRRVNENAPRSVINAVPVRAGIKYRLPLVYLKLESGVAKFSNKTESPLILSPGVGFRLLGLDVQANYETWLGETGRSFAALRIGYQF